MEVLLLVMGKKKNGRPVENGRRLQPVCGGIAYNAPTDRLSQYDSSVVTGMSVGSFWRPFKALSSIKKLKPAMVAPVC